jgi:hypothetical protein
MTRAPWRAASSRVPSVECESTTMISSQKLTAAMQRSMRSASLSVMMQADSPVGGALTSVAYASSASQS